MSSDRKQPTEKETEEKLSNIRIQFKEKLWQIEKHRAHTEEDLKEKFKETVRNNILAHFVSQLSLVLIDSYRYNDFPFYQSWQNLYFDL
jgi:hypothetical protein